jgi:hypothetical protein
MMTNLSTPAVEEIPIEQCSANDLSVNEEDTATFIRLKGELEKYGMVELPLLAPNEAGGYRILSGHHRLAAWRDLGHATCPCFVVRRPFANREEEFNFVQNLNLVRGTISRAKVVGRVREKGLDPTQLDLFKLPVSRLFPAFNKEALEKAEVNKARQARIHELTLKIAGEIAKTVADEKDELTTCIVVNDHVCAVFRVPSNTPARDVRRLAAAMKPKMPRFLTDVCDGTEAVSGEETWVPLSTIFGSARVPEPVAAVLRQAVEAMEAGGDVTETNRWQALEYLAADYLSAQSDEARISDGKE